jgi:hypothetical protein
MSPTLRRTLASVTAWFVGAIVAVSVGVLALSAIGDGWASGTPRSLQANTSGQLGTSGAGQASTSPGALAASPNRSTPRAAVPDGPEASAGTSSQTGEVWTVAGNGGTVEVECNGSSAYLRSWSPDQGYQAEDVERGWDRVVSVMFNAPGGGSVLRVRCVQGVPQPDTNGSLDDGSGHD